MAIRPFRNGDAPALAALHFASVREIGGRHYTPEQVAAWAPGPPDPEVFLRRARDGRTFLVATGEDDEPLAYGDLEADGHIDHLYRSPKAAGRGVAGALYEALEAHARSAGIPALFVEASEPARLFFEKHGFEPVGRNDFKLNGVDIHNYRMRKALSPDAAGHHATKEG